MGPMYTEDLLEILEKVEGGWKGHIGTNMQEYADRINEKVNLTMSLLIYIIKDIYQPRTPEEYNHYDSVNTPMKYILERLDHDFIINSK